MNEVIVQIGDIIGAILQPIYFSLFIFYAKGIENKRLAYITIMIFETIFLRLVLKMYDGINFELIYSVLAFVVLKLLYKKKARIPDFITFILASDDSVQGVYGKILYKVEVNLKNAYTVENKKLLSTFEKDFGYKTDMDNISNELKKKGYDGIVQKIPFNNNKLYTVFDSKNVKIIKKKK